MDIYILDFSVGFLVSNFNKIKIRSRVFVSLYIDIFALPTVLNHPPPTLYGTLLVAAVICSYIPFFLLLFLNFFFHFPLSIFFFSPSPFFILFLPIDIFLLTIQKLILWFPSSGWEQNEKYTPSLNYIQWWNKQRIGSDSWKT